MGKADYYAHGENNVICDRCGFKRKSSDVREEWNGLIVCKDTCWEPRQPQDKVRAKHDNQRPKISRPEQADRTISTPITADDL